MRADNYAEIDSIGDDCVAHTLAKIAANQAIAEVLDEKALFEEPDSWLDQSFEAACRVAERPQRNRELDFGIGAELERIELDRETAQRKQNRVDYFVLWFWASYAALVVAIVLGVVTLFSPATAKALSFDTIPGPMPASSTVTQINGLAIDGVLFNIRFDGGLDTEFFMDSVAGAWTATESIRFALFLLQAGALDNQIFIDNPLQNGMIVVAFSPTQAWSSFRSSSWNEPVVLAPAWLVSSSTGFGLIVVPEPNPLILAGLGLLGLAGGAEYLRPGAGSNRRPRGVLGRFVRRPE